MYRGRPPQHPGVVDVETARRAIQQVVQERDALARQLQRTQNQMSALERQLEARHAESQHLAQALRAHEGRGRPSDEGRVAQLEQRFQRLREQHQQLRDQLAGIVRERDVALAERDREQAARHAAEAACDELRDASPAEGRTQRLEADLANLRRHQTEAIERGVRAESDRLLLEITSVRDSVQRALSSLPGSGGPWHDGLLAVIARIDGVLEREGVSLVGHPGERFDPRLHEAVGTSEQGTADTVHQTISSGLVRFDGTVIEPARVLVGGGA